MVKPSEGFVLYGITAGHVVVQDSTEEATVGSDGCGDEDTNDILDSEDDTDETMICEEGDKIELGIEPGQVSRDPDQNEGDLIRVWESTQQDIPWSLVGKVYANSHDNVASGSNLDWALVELDEPALCQSNLLLNGPSGGNYELKEPFVRPKNFDSCSATHRVVFLSGFGGLKEGRLSTFPSFLKIGQADCFTETHSLSLPYSPGNSSPSSTSIMD